MNRTRDRVRPWVRAAVAAVSAAVSLAPRAVTAQTVPTGFQEYFIVGREQHVWDMLTRVQTGEGGPGFASGTNSVVSAIASADNQVIRYDHWEDGYEADLENPVQATTLVLGNGDPTDGRTCDFTTDPRIAPCDGTNDDLLFQGSFVNLSSDQGLGCAAPPNDRQCSVPVNPRSAAQLRYDGGDRILSSGGPLSLLHPQDPLSPFIGGATEMIPRQAVENATSYTVPVGEDLYAGNGSLTEPFKYVSLDLVAFDDGTQVFVDSPGAGTVSFTLNQGQHWSSLGAIDEGAGPALTINAGTRVSTSGPIAGLIFTGGDGTFATRMYTLLPDLLHGNDYVITAPGDDPALQGSRPLNLYIVNPDPVNPITVTATDSLGTSTIAVPAGSTVDYFTGTGRFVPAGSTVRLTGDRPFWGLSAYDHQSPSNDWGHSWLAARFATETYTVSYAPGVNDPAFQSQPAQRLANDPDCTIPPAGPGLCDSLDRSPVFVSATLDGTRVQVDFDNDGVFDPIDLDGDDFPDPAPLPNNTYVIDALQSLRVYDYTDYDNSGTQIVASRPVLVAYGQDTDQATGPDPIQDTGYAIYPINQAFLDPVLTVEKTADLSSVPIGGGLVTYTLTVRSFDFGPITSVSVFDLLPPGVVGADYVPGSTLLTYPNLVQSTADPVASIDPATGRDRLDWALSPAGLGTTQTLTVRYSVQIPAAPGGLPRVLANRGRAEGRFGSSVFSPLDTYRLLQTDVTLAKSVDRLQAAPGDVLTYTLEVTNAGLAAETNALVTDAVPPDTTFVPGSIASSGPFSGSYSAAQNAVVWTAGSFPVGGPHVLSFQVQVNPGVAPGSLLSNRALYSSDQAGTGFASDPVTTEVVGPELVISKAGPALLHPNEVATFEVRVRNVGSGTAQSLLIIDPIPPNTTFVPGSMSWRRNAGVFVALTDAADADPGVFVPGAPDEVRFGLSSLLSNEDLAFRFQVAVDPGTAGGFVNNQAGVSATDLAPVDTNLVQAPIVGDADLGGRVFLDSDGDGTQGPGEPGLANVDVVLTSTPPLEFTCAPSAAVPDGGYDGSLASMACCTIPVSAAAFGGTPTAISDLDVALSVTQTWVGDLTFKVVSPTASTLALLNRPGSAAPDDGTDTPFGDSSNLDGALITFDDDGGGPSAESLGAGLAGGGEVCTDDGICSFVPAPDTAAGLASLAGFDGEDPVGDWQVCVGDSASPDPPTFNSAVIRLTTAANPVQTRIVTTDANGDWVATVEPGSWTADVDETDPDFPNGASLTTANDPQVIVAVSGASVAGGPVGYQPAALTFTKTSDSVAGQVSPGQTVTYTLEVVNNTSVEQTGVSVVDDPVTGGVPTGTSDVPGSTVVTSPALRVTEYYVAAGDFPGTTLSLSLSQDLAPDYFVLVQGSDGGLGGDGGGQGADRGPHENYAALTADPFGTGDLGTSAASDAITLTRNAADDGWVGVVTVVECLSGCDTAGFRLLSAERVVHAGTATSGLDTSATPWAAADLGQIQLVGGFNGAGCNTPETDENDTQVCHARLFPSGTNSINWTRDTGGTTLSTATSTVMVVQWGNEWTVQRVNVTGTNGGDQVDAAGEYNTAVIAPVERARTWVWGTGHTDDNGVGDAAEAVTVTLGNGVTQNTTESTVAVATENGGTAIDFDVYVLSHPGLAVSHSFVSDGGTGEPDGDSGDLIQDVGVAAATASRMALSHNTATDTDDNYPQPMFSARFFNDSTIRLERRRSGTEFTAWVQGIDFSAVASTVAGGAPPSLVSPADGVTIPAGGTLVVSFQVVVDDPLAAGIDEIVNTARVITDQNGPFTDSVTDTVVRAGVTVEPNNAGFAGPGETLVYSHVVVNTGTLDDSFALGLSSEGGWALELLDPDTGVVLATDSNGDGVWDGGVAVDTGSLAVGESIAFDVRVAVPGGAAFGDQDTARLVATSDRNPGVTGEGTDETTVLDPATTGPVILVPDQSGVVAPGGRVVYPHRIFNETGAAQTFDLQALTTLPGWSAAWYFDANGNGVFDPGIDLQVTNTAQLPDGASQLLFTLVTAPAGAAQGTTEVVSLVAVARSSPVLLDTATDTTTVLAATSHDLAGGGTRLLGGGQTGVFPGTLFNLGDASSFEFRIGASFVDDGFAHPTQLFLPGGAGVLVLAAQDSDGDGTWDVVTPAFDTDSNGQPDVALAAGAQVSYELRRAFQPNQTPVRDPVTLTAIDLTSGQRDSVTATNLLVVATLATLSGFEVSVHEGRVVVEWSTASEVGTAGFHLERRDSDDGRFVRLNARLLPALVASPQGGHYRFVDETARAGATYAYRLVEVEVKGTQRWFGPFFVTPETAPESLGEGQEGRERKEYRRFFGRARRTSVRRGDREWKRDARRGWQARIEVSGEGLVRVGLEDLTLALRVPVSVLERWIRSGRLKLRAGGREVAWLADPDGDGILFVAEPIESAYTDRNVYTLRSGRAARPRRDPGRPRRGSPPATFRERLHVEQEFLPATTVFDDPEADFWFWDLLLAGIPGNDRKHYALHAPDVAPVGGEARLLVHLQGGLDSPPGLDRRVTVLLNGEAIGGEAWDGTAAHALELAFPQALLREGANEVELIAETMPGVSVDISYLESFELEYERLARARADRLTLDAAGARQLAVDGFTAPDVLVLEVSDPSRPRLVVGGRVEASGAGYRVRFRSRPGGRYLVTRAAAARGPAAVEADEPGLLRDRANAAEVVVIAPEGFEAGAEALAGLRRRQGLSARVVRLQDVYDEFNHGRPHPLAIRSFLERATDAWAVPPRYVVLAGDGSLDFKDRLGRGDSPLPPALVATPDGLFASDNRLADLEGDDGIPELAIGRLPVQTPAELDAWVARAAAYAAAGGDWRGRALWVADDPDPGGEFTRDAEELRELLPQGSEVVPLYVEELGAAAVRARLLEELGRGAGLVTYLGHGGLDRLANEGLLRTADVPGLLNGDRMPFVTALTCVAARFEIPGYDSMAEALVLSESGGAVGVWAPSGPSFNEDARTIGRGFLEGIQVGVPRLGDAILRGLRAHAGLEGRQAHAPFLYTLLGDPSSGTPLDR